MAGNKTKDLSSVTHSARTVYHHQHRHHCQFIISAEQKNQKSEFKFGLIVQLSAFMILFF